MIKRPTIHWALLFLTLIFALFLGRSVLSNPVPPAPPQTLIRTLNADLDFGHQVGRGGRKGWEVDYKQDRPGYALSHLRDPLLLDPGLYRLTFKLRRGTYPRKGFLYPTYSLFRLELWDINTQELITEREFQISDFPRPNRFEERWIEFSMENRHGHIVEPRIMWLGLANGEIEQVEISRFPDVSPRSLAEKAMRLENEMEKICFENGFVVSRRPNGEPDETGDAVTYTSWYVSALAWKYSVTKDPLTMQSLENSLQTLHNAIKGTYERPVLTRYVDEDGIPHPKSSSKDTYTAYFFALKTAAPFIKNSALKKQMVSDLNRMASRILKEDLVLSEGQGETLRLNTHFTEDKIRQGIRKLFAQKDQHHKFIKTLKKANSYLPFGQLWPGYDDLIHALRHKDEEKLINMCIPTLNGMVKLAARARDLLREQYRSDLFPRRFTNRNYPGKKLEQFLTNSLSRFPAGRGDIRFNRLSDFKILGSNGILALHLIRSAGELTRSPQFDEYYRTNLYTQDALLKTALDWYEMDEDVIKLTAGNPEADQNRKGCLTFLALYSLVRMEQNPSIKESYLSLLDRSYQSFRHDDNPLLMALRDAAFQKKNHTPFILRALALYPEDRRGYGENYWRTQGHHVGQLVGSGDNHRYAREAVPVSHRPKDSFLWQRNSRQLFGDEEKLYPATDYLFLYWFSRAHELIPGPPPVPMAGQK